jgi:hypothetical protein
VRSKSNVELEFDRMVVRTGHRLNPWDAVNIYAVHGTRRAPSLNCAAKAIHFIAFAEHRPSFVVRTGALVGQTSPFHMILWPDAFYYYGFPAPCTGVMTTIHKCMRNPSLSSSHISRTQVINNEKRCRRIRGCNGGVNFSHSVVPRGCRSRK